MAHAALLADDEDADLPEYIVDLADDSLYEEIVGQGIATG